MQSCPWIAKNVLSALIRHSTNTSHRMIQIFNLFHWAMFRKCHQNIEFMNEWSEYSVLLIDRSISMRSIVKVWDCFGPIEKTNCVLIFEFYSRITVFDSGNFYTWPTIGLIQISKFRPKYILLSRKFRFSNFSL